VAAAHGGEEIYVSNGATSMPAYVHIPNAFPISTSTVTQPSSHL